MPFHAEKRLFPNPFYVLLLIASTLFVLTVLGYLISPTILGEPVGERPTVGSLAVAGWLDRNGPLALAIEVVGMIAFGLLAMATDRFFAPRKRR